MKNTNQHMGLTLAQRVNCQQQNFKEILHKMSGVDGWRLFEDDGLLALAAPSTVNFVNFVWGEPSLDNISKVKSFYENANFLWLTSEYNTVDTMVQNGFNLDGDAFFEMMLDVEQYEALEISSKVQVIIPQTNSELDDWSKTAIQTFGCSDDEFKEFFYPLIKFALCIPILVMYDGQSAGTAMVYCGQRTAGIYAMSTLEQYRLKGCATAAVNACILIAKDKNLHNAVLYSSKIGEALYEKIGFIKTDIFQEWCLKVNYT